ncbi:MAG: hypothetical protein M0Z31_10430 [Clostridia bacterium]|nr:hypothetical protein [Clostridia bacterium]
MKKSGVRYIDARIILLQVVCLIVLVVLTYKYLDWVEVTKVEISSPELKSSLTISAEEKVEKIVDGVEKARILPGKKPPGKYVIKLFSRKEIRVFHFGEGNYLYDLQGGRLLGPPPQLKKYLQEIREELRRRSPYGELLDWDEVKYLFPYGVKAKVTDLDTGKSFLAQRLAGYSHADVKSLTPQDKKVIKEIYGGNWSWKRRAVLVHVGGRKVAASLSGMPHGQDGKGGFFDLRFPLQGDKRSGDSLSYRFMYYKAAGKMGELYRKATPGETILLLFTAIDQGDWENMKALLTSSGRVEGKGLNEIIGVTVHKIKEKDELGFELGVTVTFRQGPYNDRRNVLVKLRWNAKAGYYQAEPEFLPGLLGKFEKSF